MSSIFQYGTTEGIAADCVVMNCYIDLSWQYSGVQHACHAVMFNRWTFRQSGPQIRAHHKVNSC